MTGTVIETMTALPVGVMQSPTPYTINIEHDSQEKLLSDIPGVNALALWKQMTVLVPPMPRPKAVAHKWE
jgi:gentisate 1,2-dioxygenase